MTSWLRTGKSLLFFYSVSYHPKAARCYSDQSGAASLFPVTYEMMSCFIFPRLRDWRVERTPINTPDSDLNSCSKLPHRASEQEEIRDVEDDEPEDVDDEDDDDDEHDDDYDDDMRDSLSLNSETDLGSRCSGKHLWNTNTSHINKVFLLLSLEMFFSLNFIFPTLALF